MDTSRTLVRCALVAAAAMLTSVSCSDHPTAVPSADRAASPEAPSLKKDPGGRAALLTNVPVTGTLADGGTFAGTMTATHIAMDPATRALTLSGVLNGTATTATGTAIAVVNQAFTTPITLNRQVASSGGSAGIYQNVSSRATCGILLLDLGPLHLDLLGLTVDLNEVVLAVNAVSGAGNLLGNLLCAVVGLLDLPGALSAITQLLGTINNILAGVSTLNATMQHVLPHAMTIPFSSSV